MLDHWDNLDRTRRARIRRARRSGSGTRCPIRFRRATATTRARTRRSASTASSLTNVNANAKVLTPEYLTKVAALAGVFRPYGIRVYLTARFSAPIEIGGLKTADPLDPAVRAWWKAKADEIYASIPDFGGFLVKANSEGQPGPQDYKRTHADGANMLADAVASARRRRDVARVRLQQRRADRSREAGVRRVQAARRHSSATTCSIQVKNGPLDFQPREPFSSALRRDAEDAADDGIPDHQGIPRPGHASRLPRAAMSRKCSTPTPRRNGKGSTVAQGDRRVAARLSAHGHRRRRRTSAPIATGRARSSIRRTGTRSAGSRGIRRCRRPRSPTSGSRMTFTNDPKVGRADRAHDARCRARRS